MGNSSTTAEFAKHMGFGMRLASNMELLLPPFLFIIFIIIGNTVFIIFNFDASMFSLRHDSNPLN